jgi:peptidoglycan hydrolase-like protein with peptidoglycan-binding domain
VDRYKEIQRALADRGYFHGEIDGIWGPDSMDAMKHFQTDQHLDADGKLDALSLIGLGLGPKRTLSAQAANPNSEEP